ncbi:Di-sulfide bridge nucleocytoplasmic transport domain-containing protein [Mycena sp. CBHHK59/15]|nr:Di-sulfide bridge nucleocytoplasmic transport domain-containing protein [Mycena sp. CBHHK59/15]
MSASRLRSQRSTDAPMDFEYTSRPNTGKAWASSTSSSEDPSTPKKRPHADVSNPPTPLHNPIFGQNQNIPFIFQTPPPPTPQGYPWGPPAGFDAAKAFPPQELRDVDMGEASPPKPAAAEDGSHRKIATGGMRRILKARMKSGLALLSDDEDGGVVPRTPTQNTSNHYTLHMPAPAAPQSDLPYVLLGYLQFFFNLSLILLFLYLVVQFIVTVQRDVEERISEYSMVQDIAMCALHHKNNLCDKPLPAMASQCASWATCMSRDPTVVGRAKVGAEMIAEVVNGFVEPISWKTLAFTLTSLSFLTVFINTLLSLYRARHQPRPVEPQQFPTAYHPAHHFGGYLSPAPTPSWGRSARWTAQEEMETPSRRRRLDGGGAVKIK